MKEQQDELFCSDRDGTNSLQKEVGTHSRGGGTQVVLILEGTKFIKHFSGEVLIRRKHSFEGALLLRNTVCNL